VFGQSRRRSRKDDKIVGITAAMPSGTGIDIFNKPIPPHLRRRIAEQHAGDVAAVLHRKLQTVCAIYRPSCSAATTSRATDVGDPEPPVGFAIDRGAWRRRRRDPCGSFDNAYLGACPIRHHGGLRRSQLCAHGS